MGSSEKPDMTKEISIPATIATIVLALGGSLTWTQAQSLHNCEVKGPARCSMAAIKPW
jgi:hypothetical protein